MKIDSLAIKIFADTACLKEIASLQNISWIQGFTTNPALMKKAGITDYKNFAEEALFLCQQKPLSFEVISDDLEEMKKEALEIASWGENIYVKIPITTTTGISTGPLIEFLTKRGICVNVTAIFQKEQIDQVFPFLDKTTPSILSLFAGRIADTGRNPVELVSYTLSRTNLEKNIEILWASCREIYNVIEAEKAGCHIITVPKSFLEKMNLLGKNLTQFSLETVKMLHQEAVDAGYQILPQKLKETSLL